MLFYLFCFVFCLLQLVRGFCTENIVREKIWLSTEQATNETVAKKSWRYLLQIQTDRFKRQVNCTKTNQTNQHTYSILTFRQRCRNTLLAYLSLRTKKSSSCSYIVLIFFFFFQTINETLTDNFQKYSIYLLVDEDDEDWFIVSVQNEKEITRLLGSEDINSFRKIDPFGGQLVLRKLSCIEVYRFEPQESFQ